MLDVLEEFDVVRIVRGAHAALLAHALPRRRLPAERIGDRRQLRLVHP